MNGVDALLTGTYYAEARDVTTGCVSLSRLAVSVTAEDTEKPVFLGLASMSQTVCPDDDTEGDTPQTAAVYGLSLTKDMYEDNCTTDDNITIQYRIVQVIASGNVRLVDFGEDYDDIGPITTSDASGFKFPEGVSRVIYRVTDEAGNYQNRVFKITVNHKPNPGPIYY